MKQLTATTVAFCLLSIVLLGAFAMHYGEGMLHNGCFAAMNSGTPCAQKDWALADFHIGSLKVFSLAVLAVFAFAAFAVVFQGYIPQLASAARDFQLFRYWLLAPILAYSAKRALSFWLALKINSPSFV